MAPIPPNDGPVLDGCRLARRLLGIHAMENNRLPRAFLPVLGLLNATLFFGIGWRCAILSLSPGPPAMATVLQVIPPTPLASVVPEPLSPSIAVLGEVRELSRAFLEQQAESASYLARNVRIVPHLTNGRPDGFKLYAIHPGSIFSQLGFRNGDTILRINGLELSSPDRCLAVYSQLRAVERIIVELERNRAPFRLEYKVS